MKIKSQIILKAIALGGGTQDKLAEKAGISQTTVHRLLNSDKKAIELVTALKICKATGISLKEFCKEYAGYEI